MPFNGYFDCKVAGKQRRFYDNDAHEFVERIPRALSRMIRRVYDDPATLVPIPNSHVTSPSEQGFKTLALAQGIAGHSEGKFKAIPALVFAEKQRKSHEGGPRSADHFEAAYRVVKEVNGPIILIDDVCTGGGHLIGAYRRLNTIKSPVVLACTFGRTTKDQIENPIGVHEEELELKPSYFSPI